MKIPSAVIAVLIYCLSGINASVIPKSQFDGPKDAEKFRIRIEEGRTRFYEDIEVNEEKETALFKVPAHNGRLANDELFDFKMNVTVSRLVEKEACYIKPLPSDVPRPKILEYGLKGLTSTTSDFNVKTVSKLWIATEKVDQTALSQQLQEFCGEYPVYRLEEFKPNAVTAKHGRSRRDMKFVFCENIHPPRGCRQDEWRYSCKVSAKKCVYLIACDLDWQKLAICSTLEHTYDSLVCCSPFCP